MKILKNLLIVIGVIVALILIIAAFMPKNYEIEKEVVINKPKAEVFNYIKYVKNQDNFSKWNMMDPNIKKSYSGTDGTVGFIYGWESEKMGQGEQEIKKITEGENMDKIDFELRFKKPWEATSPTYMTAESISPNETRVKWGFSGTMPYPMNITRSFMKSALGNDFQTGLDNLKTVLEK